MLTCPAFDHLYIQRHVFCGNKANLMGHEGNFPLSFSRSFPPLAPPIAVFGFIPEGQGIFMHHDGSVGFQKEEICTSCHGDVGFLCRRADSMVLQRMLLLIYCCSTLDKINSFSIACLVEQGSGERCLVK